jgi:hypothetical protein
VISAVFESLSGDGLLVDFLQFSRLTKILFAVGHTATVLTFELRVFDQGLVLLLIAKMKSLGYNVAEVLAVRVTFAF